MSSTVTDVQVLQASVDPENQSDFRILVDRKVIKYLTIDSGLYDVGDMCFAPALISILPPLPPGDWNKGHISQDTSNMRPHFAEITKAQLPGITKVWHPLQIDYLELQMGKKLRSNVYEATCPRFNSTIIAKFARFEWEMPRLDAETSAYQWIENQQIGPKLLGHLSEEGRVIGFIIERITNCHHATPEDLPLCQQTLSKLHRLGVKHGDVNKHNFLIHDGTATLIDFENSTRCNDAKVLEGEEFQKLQEELQDTSGRGGRIVESDTA
jgi:predicted Ser/Thr protein kinase